MDDLITDKSKTSALVPQLKADDARQIARKVLNQNIEINIENVLEQVKNSSSKGLFETKYEGSLTELQINNLKSLGYFVKKIGNVKEGSETHLVAW
jgi:cell division ATPase FtsA